MDNFSHLFVLNDKKLKKRPGWPIFLKRRYGYKLKANPVKKTKGVRHLYGSNNLRNTQFALCTSYHYCS